ncbi:recombinase family protein [Streptomyces sp. PSKA30]|uniref:recombinase family protein n=1 Tax=Streptomyces sp. PSKA30 TaxID=2874597 RepID=UPI001CD0C55A|nr:recombinase family protein [Streptomyces sp. PSKA30]MBZ9638592.1 recombinase family protein [Streptomyces sp. PSKA30]
MPKRSPQPSQPNSAPTGSTRALGVVRLSTLTEVTTSPGRQRAAIQRCAERLDLALIAEAADLGVSARRTSPFERPSLSPWLQRPGEYDAIVWSHVDRAVRSVVHMSQLIEWGQKHATTLVFGMPEEDQPLVVAPQAGGGAIRRCMDLAYAAEQEARAISARLTSAHEALRATGRYGGGLVPFGYQKAPHPSGVGWCLAPDPETTDIVRMIVEDVHSGLSLVAIARKLEAAGIPVPRDRHAQLQGRPMGGRRHGRDFERFRWRASSLSKVLRTPALMGHRVHRGKTVCDAEGSPVLIGPPLLTEQEFQALQDVLDARSNGIHPKRRETSLLIGVAYCTGCSGRMYFAARKAYAYGDYVCRASARGTTCPAPAAIRADWLDDYTVGRYREAFATDGEVTREQLLRDGVRVTVTKGRSGGGPDRLVGPDTSRLALTIGGALPDQLRP